jgi:hypothetical protein
VLGGPQLRRRGGTRVLGEVWVRREPVVYGREAGYAGPVGGSSSVQGVDGGFGLLMSYAGITPDAAMDVTEVTFV